MVTTAPTAHPSVKHPSVDKSAIFNKEKDTNTISYRVHGSNETTTMDTQGFIDKLINQIKEHK